MTIKNKDENAVNKYLSTLNPVAFEVISKLRPLLIKALPNAKEGISYGVISFSDNKHFLYYAGYKGHIGIYPPLVSNKKLITRTKKYRNIKGNLIFKFKDEIPYDLIIEVAKALREQYGKQSKREKN